MQKAEGESVIHKPVMVKQAIEYLNPQPGGIYVDATIGMGGHAEELLKHLGETGRLIGLDRDGSALEISSQRIKDSRLDVLKCRFSEIDTALKDVKADGVLLDLGVSMMQLKAEGRGFSFMKDESLDMRMDKTSSITASFVVNTYSAKELTRILEEYGEERLARKIAKIIVESRPLKTTLQLAGLVEKVYGGRGRIHPATKTFQAIRIEVNRELDEIKAGLRNATKILNHGGRLVVISYHSLEDRIVKNFFRDSQKEGTLNRLTKKPLTPDFDEIRRNPAARSAKLRAAEAL